MRNRKSELLRKRVVFPGEKIGVAEEFLPGNGLVEKDGEILAVSPGIFELNIIKRVGSVKWVKPHPILKRGDRVLARIIDISKNIAGVHIFGLELNKGREILPLDLDGVAFLSNYGNKFRPFDIIRARVSAIKSIIIIDLDDDDLGLMYAVCPNCTGDLILTPRRRLRCEKCKRIYRRKIAPNNWFKKRR